MYGTCCVFNLGLPLSLLYVLRTVEKGEWGGGGRVFLYMQEICIMHHTMYTCVILYGTLRGNYIEYHCWCFLVFRTRVSLIMISAGTVLVASLSERSGKGLPFFTEKKLNKLFQGLVCTTVRGYGRACTWLLPVSVDPDKCRQGFYL
jgi:hypothetical protein